MPIKNWDEVINEDFPKVEEVTRDMLEAAANLNFLYPYCGVRVCIGRLMTSKETEHRREYARASKLLNS